MLWAIELSGEHASLPRAEARALVAMAGARPRSAGHDRVLLAEGDLDPAWLAERIALAWRILQVHERSPLDVEAIVATADAIDLDGQTFAVRCSRLDPAIDPDLAPRIERALGEALSAQGEVDLEAPAVTVRVLLGEDAIVGTEQASIDRSSFEDRHVEARPYFSPVSLHPRLARALVNLAQVSPGDTVWDPFTGTGGVALEAALVGGEVTASDIDPEMLEGTRSTLTHFGLEAKLLEGDVAEVADRLDAVDAIVTDPPYGRASTTNKEDLLGLYDRFFEASARLLGPGDRLACILPDPSATERAPDALEVLGSHAWYVHGSLTRHVTVLEHR